MRVLWFTNGPMPAINRRHGKSLAGSGFWMSTLLETLRQEAGIQIDVATAHPGFRSDQFEDQRINYFILGQPRFYPIFRCRKRDLDNCVEIVHDRKPDIVHIHGSERFFGLLAARHLISTPCVISLQGFLQACLPVFFGALRPADLWKSTRLIELATRRGLFWSYRAYAEGLAQEREILSGASYFMGRTAWDQAVVRASNPGATYYHVGELLRPEFHHFSWNLEHCDRHVVFSTNAGGEPRRGTEVLMRAMAIVRKSYPDAKLRLAGQIGMRRGYDRFLRRFIVESGLQDSIECLGYLNAEDLGRHLCRAHIFVTPSFVENSPNSVCEAMQVGLPCIASYAGGIPSVIEQERTGLLFSAGDSAMLAAEIMRVFRQEDLARRLGRAARAEASDRHAPRTVMSQLLAAYRDVINNANGEYYRTAALPA